MKRSGGANIQCNATNNGSATEPVDNKKHCKKCIDNRTSLKCAGPYVLGPCIGTTPVKSITQCLARKMSTENFYTLKLLTISDSSTPNDIKQGKMLIHTEYSLLSLLHEQDGVVHTHGLFQDEVNEIIDATKPNSNYLDNNPMAETIKGSGSATKNEAKNPPALEFMSNGKKCKRLCLVLDCLAPHNYCQNTLDMENLQHYVIKEKKLCERKALVIFLDIIRVVKDLHEVSL